jgi:hypothetical protein
MTLVSSANIHLVEERPLFWDITYSVYKERSWMRGGWKGICLELEDVFEDLSGNDKNEVKFNNYFSFLI